MNKTLSLAAFSLLLAPPLPAHATPFGVPGVHGPLEIMRDVLGGTLMVKNNLPVEVTAVAACGKGGSEKIALTIRPGGPFVYPFKAKSDICKIEAGLVGRLNAKPSDEIYRLPWQDGKAFCVVSLFVKNGLYSSGPAMFRMPEGEPVIATRGGIVGFVKTETQTAKYGKVGAQNSVEIVHSDGTVGRYLPIRAAKVKVGDKVEAGQQIAEMSEPTGPKGSILFFHLAVPTKSGEYAAIPYKFSIGKPEIKFTPKDGMKPFAQYVTPASIPSLTCNSFDPSKPRFPTGGILNDAYHAQQQKH